GSWPAARGGVEGSLMDAFDPTPGPSSSPKGDDPSGPRPVVGHDLTMGYLGVMSILVGIIILLPLLLLPFYPEELSVARCFLLPGLGAIGVGALLARRIKGRPHGRMYKGQDATVIVLTWLVAMNVGALPFVLTGDYDFSQAVFETMSGLSTTTLTVTDVAAAPHLILMYRSVLLFFGGIGLVLVVVSAVSDTHGMRIYGEEGHTDRLLPNLARSARLIMGIYCLYIGVGTIALTCAGMSVFDALNHAMGAVATGGFSTKADNVAAYDSPLIEVILMVLMMLGATNFMLHMRLLKRRFGTFFRDIETRTFLVATAVAVALVTAILYATGTCPTLASALRVGAFQAVSAVTTTGFQTVPSLAGWPSAAMLVLVVVMVAGAETNSTGGGIKQWRAALLVRMLVWDIRDHVTHRRCVHSNMVERYDRRVPIGAEERQEVLVFVLLYVVVLLAGTFVYTCFGYSLEDSLFQFASALGTVGLSIGIPLETASPWLLWATTIGMFLGRLEIYPVLVVATHVAQRGNKMLRHHARH
ncbi:MAG: TrkH family potassium uptake protein, partial [Atopobiaceae bacterium]|nr:TrkH family potassium uptake protein [Atopobiaceae bacterium]